MLQIEHRTKQYKQTNKQKTIKKNNSIQIFMLFFMHAEAAVRKAFAKQKRRECVGGSREGCDVSSDWGDNGGMERDWAALGAPCFLLLCLSWIRAQLSTAVGIATFKLLQQ